MLGLRFPQGKPIILDEGVQPALRIRFGGQRRCRLGNAYLQPLIVGYPVPSSGLLLVLIRSVAAAIRSAATTAARIGEGRGQGLIKLVRRHLRKRQFSAKLLEVIEGRALLDRLLRLLKGSEIVRETDIGTIPPIAIASRDVVVIGENLAADIGAKILALLGDRGLLCGDKGALPLQFKLEQRLLGLEFALRIGHNAAGGGRLRIRRLPDRRPIGILRLLHVGDHAGDMVRRTGLVGKSLRGIVHRAAEITEGNSGAGSNANDEADRSKAGAEQTSGHGSGLHCGRQRANGDHRFRQRRDHYGDAATEKAGCKHGRKLQRDIRHFVEVVGKRIEPGNKALRRAKAFIRLSDIARERIFDFGVSLLDRLRRVRRHPLDHGETAHECIEELPAGNLALIDKLFELGDGAAGGIEPVGDSDQDRASPLIDRIEFLSLDARGPEKLTELRERARRLLRRLALDPQCDGNAVGELQQTLLRLLQIVVRLRRLSEKACQRRDRRRILLRRCI